MDAKSDRARDDCAGGDAGRRRPGVRAGDASPAADPRSPPRTRRSRSRSRSTATTSSTGPARRSGCSASIGRGPSTRARRAGPTRTETTRPTPPRPMPRRSRRGTRTRSGSRSTRTAGWGSTASRRMAPPPATGRWCSSSSPTSTRTASTRSLTCTGRRREPSSPTASDRCPTTTPPRSGPRSPTRSRPTPRSCSTPSTSPTRPPPTSRTRRAIRSPGRAGRDGGCTLPVTVDGTDPGSDPQTYTAVGMQALVDAIRATGASQPILLGGLSYANDLSGWLAHEPTDPDHQLAASFHNYEGEACSTLSCWNDEIAPVAAQVPVVTGEFDENDVCPAGPTTASIRPTWTGPTGPASATWPGAGTSRAWLRNYHLDRHIRRARSPERDGAVRPPDVVGHDDPSTEHQQHHAPPATSTTTTSTARTSTSTAAPTHHDRYRQTTRPSPRPPRSPAPRRPPRPPRRPRARRPPGPAAPVTLRRPAADRRPSDQGSPSPDGRALPAGPGHGTAPAELGRRRPAPPAARSRNGRASP